MSTAKATHQDPHYITVPASADLSTKQYLFMTITSGQLAVAGAGVRVAGVLDNKPNAADVPGTLQYSGVALVIAGGSITAGDAIASDAAGKAVTASGTAIQVGIALAAATSGAYCPVLLTPSGAIASGGALEIVSANGAISVAKQTTLLSISGTKAYTLASGLYDGQRKWIQCSVAASIPSGVVTGVFLDTDGTTARTTATFDAVADQLILEWTGAAWQVLTKTSVTMG
jgi:hypothetical protein